MEIEIKMPDLSTTTVEIMILKWLVEVGQEIKKGQALLEVETDKATMVVESAATGTIKALQGKPGDRIAVGDVIAVVESSSNAKGPLAPFSKNRASNSDTYANITPEKPGVLREMTMAITPNTFTRINEYQKDFLLGLYERMVLIREFEEQVKFLFLEGSMPGTIHQCQGQEATAVGVCSALNADDYLTSTHRPHGHALAKGLDPVEILIELFGGGTGCCKGKGGSMHVGNIKKGMVPAIAITGGGIPLATGMALAFKMKRTSQVAVCFFGDGASSEGIFHEAVNIAAIWDLPVIYVCENNLYGASTRIDKVMRASNVVERASGYKIKCKNLFGNDVLAVYEAARKAVETCRNGEGPVLLELMTYRIIGHSRRDPCHYQAKEEKEFWLSREPILIYGQELVKRDDIDESELKAIRLKVEQRIAESIEEARQAPKPTIESLTTDVYCE